jgi:hypothetical protein
MISIFNGRRHSLGREAKSEVYIQVDVNFREKLRHFKGSELLVFFAIALRIDQDRIAFPGYEQIIEDTGLNRNAVAAAVKGLAEKRIDGHRVLSYYRERNERNLLTGSNIYTVFPDPSESNDSYTLGDPEESPDSVDSRTFENSYVRKSILEEETVLKEETSLKKKQRASLSQSTFAGMEESTDVPIKAVRKKTQELPVESSEHPYVAIYREIFRRFPTRAQMEFIRTLDVSDGRINHWKSCCESWMLSGFSPTNIQGIVDWFNNGISLKNRANGSSANGRVPPAMTDAERRAYIAQTEVMEDER